MFKSFNFLLSLFFLIFFGQLSAQESGVSTGKPQKVESKVIVKVNGDAITSPQVDALGKMIQQQYGGRKILSKESLTEEVINSSLLSQAAEVEKIHLRPEVVDALAIQRRSVLSALMLQELTTRLQLKDEEIEKAYESVPSKEFRVNYILAKDKAVAEEVIKRLKDGVNFTALAANFSLDPSAKHNGNLGWLSGLQIDSAFLKLLKTLDKGDHAHGPVKNSDTVRIIQLVDERSYSKPAYAQVREQLANALLQENILDYMDKLRSAADIAYQ